MVVDDCSVKLKNLSNDINEDDIIEAMSKFGAVTRVKIPKDQRDENVEEEFRRNKGLAFVTYSLPMYAQRALEANEINIDICVLAIEPSMKRFGAGRERRDGPRTGGPGESGGFELLRRQN